MDLEDLAAFKRVFEPEGFKGVSLYCQDCLEEHYYGTGHDVEKEFGLTSLLAIIEGNPSTSGIETEVAEEVAE